ncbi:hypothetical protein B0H19DRAFT_109304 [Mycena capillaripes]|nr:hypothetical protein B0H19DRAFT_109304 [Mycena capillaripes]
MSVRHSALSFFHRSRWLGVSAATSFMISWSRESSSSASSSSSSSPVSSSGADRSSGSSGGEGPRRGGRTSEGTGSEVGRKAENDCGQPAASVGALRPVLHGCDDRGCVGCSMNVITAPSVDVCPLPSAFRSKIITARRKSVCFIPRTKEERRDQPSSSFCASRASSSFSARTSLLMVTTAGCDSKFHHHSPRCCSARCAVIPRSGAAPQPTTTLPHARGRAGCAPCLPRGSGRTGSSQIRSCHRPACARTAVRTRRVQRPAPRTALTLHRLRRDYSLA